MPKRRLFTVALILLSIHLGGGGSVAVLFADTIRTVDPNLEVLAEDTDPMPRVLLSTADGKSPIFVAADRVLLPDGTVDPAMFDIGRAHIIQKGLATPSSGECIQLDLEDSSHFPPNGRTTPIAEVIQDSENVVVAEITGRIYGYKSFNPGTLLRVVTREVLRGESIRELFFVHFPVGSFHVGKHRMCRTTVGFPSPPDIGEHLLLLYDDSQVSRKTELLSLRATKFVVLPKNGPVVFSEYLSSASKSSADWNSEQFIDFASLQLAREPREERIQ